MRDNDEKVNGSESSASPESLSSTETAPQAKGKHFYARVATSPKKGTHPNVLRRPPRMLMCLRIDGIFFAFNRSFVREGTLHEPDKTIQSLTKLREGLQKFPKGKVAIFGHADYVDDIFYNKKLSERRAEAVYALLTFDASIWQRLYTEEKWWKDTSISTVIKNRKPDIEAYMESLLKPAGLAGGIKAKAKFCPIWPRSAREHPFMGCSEYNPLVVFSPAQLKAHKKDHRKRDEDNEPNRRVVVFIFDESSPPHFPCMHSSESSPKDAAKNCDIPKPWKQNKEYKRHVTPTFACKFYDQQIAYDCSDEIPPALVPIPMDWEMLVTGFEDGRRAKHKDRTLMGCAFHMQFKVHVRIQKESPGGAWKLKFAKIVGVHTRIEPNFDKSFIVLLRKDYISKPRIMAYENYYLTAELVPAHSASVYGKPDSDVQKYVKRPDAMCVVLRWPHDFGTSGPSARITWKYNTTVKRVEWEEEYPDGRIVTHWMDPSAPGVTDHDAMDLWTTHLAGGITIPLCEGELVEAVTAHRGWPNWLRVQVNTRRL